MCGFIIHLFTATAPLLHPSSASHGTHLCCFVTSPAAVGENFFGSTGKGKGEKNNNKRHMQALNRIGERWGEKQIQSNASTTKYLYDKGFLMTKPNYSTGTVK